MPGSPDPVLGSDVSTHVVASLAGLLAVTIAVRLRRRLREGRRPAALLGVGYAAATLAVWTAARTVTDAFPSGFVDHPVEAAGYTAVVFVVLAAQFGVLARVYARFGLLTPLVGLFGLTELVWWAFLQVRGETDPLGMYVFFGPALVVGVLLVAGAEYAGRRVWTRVAGRRSAG